MANTIIITRTNGSLAIPSMNHLVKMSPDSTVALTVRDTSDSDVNTTIPPPARGYLELLNPYGASEDSQNEKTQEVLCAKRAEWVGVTEQDTALGNLFK